MPETIYSIYKITNQLNQKVYIGQTIQKLEQRFKQHCGDSRCRRIANSIQKHGIENFTIELIETCKTRDECNRKEIHWIIFYNSTDPKVGYNISLGGLTCERSEEYRKNISLAKQSTKNPMYGKPSTRRIKIICNETNKIFNSMHDAANYYDLSVTKICAVVNGRRKTHGKLSFSKYQL